MTLVYYNTVISKAKGTWGPAGFLKATKIQNLAHKAWIRVWALGPGFRALLAGSVVWIVIL